MPAYAEAANAIEAIIKAEFPEYNVLHDRLHESIGHERAAIGISPDSQSPQADNYNVLDTYLTVQFYDKYVLDVNPNQVRDPRVITEKAERLMGAIRDYGGPTSGNLWYFNVVSVDYPNDATGNKTRFEMTLLAKAYNPALVETG